MSDVTDDLNFEDIDKAFSDLDNELEKLVGPKKEEKSVSGIKREEKESKKVNSSVSARKNSFFDLFYHIGTNVYTSTTNLSQIFNNVDDLERVLPGQLISYQSVNKKKIGYYPGKNTVSTKDFSRFYSTCNGIVSWVKRKVNVEPIEVFDKEISPNRKQINVNKTALIKTKLPTNIKIRSTGDIYVTLNVGDVELYSEGNIYFMNGLTGRGQAKITARGSVFARFIENATVRAGDNVIVGETILNSKVYANNAIVLTGKKQTIVAGNYTAGNFIKCKVVGSENFVTTNLTTGLLGDEKAQVEESKARLEEINNRNIVLNKQMSQYVVKKANGELNEEETKIMDDIKIEKDKLQEDKKKCEENLKKIESTMKDRINCTVNISEIVYPGVNIELNKQLYDVKKEIKKTSFILDDNKIRQVAFRDKEIEIEETEEVNNNKVRFLTEGKFRRNITLTGKNLSEIEARASEFLKIKKELLVSIMINKSDDFYKVAYFERFPNEKPGLIRKKALKVIKVEKIQLKGFTIEDCLNSASKGLGLPVDRLDYVVLDKGNKGMLGLGKKPMILDVFQKKEKRKVENIRSVDAVFKIKNDVDGLKLLVGPAEGEGKTIEYEDVMSSLETKKYLRNLDKDKIREIVNETKNEFISIAPRQPEPQLDGKFELEISEDKLTAILKVTPPKRGGIYPEIEFIERHIKEKGIKKYDVEKIKAELIEENRSKKEIVIIIAKGKEIVPAVNPKIELKFETNSNKNSFSEEDKIDFREMSAVINVVEGQLLAEITPGKDGIPGENVLGDEIPVEPQKEIVLKPGKNVRVSDDGFRYFSEMEGWVIFSTDQIRVENVYNIDGDVDFNTGNIYSLGTVIVKGILRDGFKIEAAGDVVVGAVESADITASGNITVKAGVQGKGTAKLKCKGDFSAKFVEQANIEAEGSVIIYESLMHSSVIAQNHLIVLKGKKGLIVGGHYRAGNIIAAKNIGSKIATQTVLEVGYNPFVKLEIDQAFERGKNLKAEFGQTRLNLQRLVSEIKSDPDAPQTKKDLLTKLTKKYQKMALEVKTINERLNMLQHKLKDNKQGYVLSKEKTYTNVEINIRNYTYKVRNEIDYATFYVDDGEIKFKEFDEITLDKNTKNLL